MRLTLTLFLGLVVGAVALSCGGNQPPPAGQSRPQTLAGSVTQAQQQGGAGPSQAAPQARQGRQNKAQANAAQSRAAPGKSVRLPVALDPAATTAPRQSEAPTPPPDAQWTLFCCTVSGDGHVERARKMKQDLLRNTDLREWYLVHGQAESTLYYGFYRSINDESNDAAESRRAQADRQTVDALADAAGRRPFRNCMFVQLASPDPTSPAEWDLAKVNAGRDPSDPNWKFWSLQVAAYTGDTDRKKAAVDSVRAAREMGLEAYYFHGPSVSSVCLGSWPYGSAVEEHVDLNPAAAKRDPESLILVLPEQVNARRAIIRDKSGRPVRAVQLRLRVVDASLLAMMRQYPHHAVNGEEELLRGANGKMTNKPTFLVQIPGSGAGGLTAPGALVQGADGAGGQSAMGPDDPWGMYDASAAPGGGNRGANRGADRPGRDGQDRRGTGSGSGGQRPRRLRSLRDR